MKTLAELLCEALPLVQAELGGVTEAEVARQAGIDPANLYRAKHACREITLARVLALSNLALALVRKDTGQKV